ncbi:hypothetical protein B0H19DRAFT_1256720 [Mycena capillaripes]|nr:hypothetical protein B0H19DRAFT_1256720 [Mycena capillaripes]
MLAIDTDMFDSSATFATSPADGNVKNSIYNFGPSTPLERGPAKVIELHCLDDLHLGEFPASFDNSTSPSSAGYNLDFETIFQLALGF